MNVFQMMTISGNTKRKIPVKEFDNSQYLTTGIDEYLVLDTNEYLVVSGVMI